MIGFEFSIQSSVFRATTVAKVNLFSTLDTVLQVFTLNVSIEINPFKHR